jgi:hypothetical protein
MAVPISSPFTVIDTTEKNSQQYVDTNIVGDQVYAYRVKAYKDSVCSDYSNEVSILAGVEKEIIPEEYSISQSYPNPFNPKATIEYQVPRLAKVTIVVYDILWKEVATLVNEEVKAGYHTVTFDGTKYSSGIYFVRMMAQGSDAKSYVKTMKIVLMK